MNFFDAATISAFGSAPAVTEPGSLSAGEDGEAEFEFDAVPVPFAGPSSMPDRSLLIVEHPSPTLASTSNTKLNVRKFFIFKLTS